jgi:hypothetical protein
MAAIVSLSQLSQGIADGETEQHAPDAVGSDGLLMRRRWLIEQRRALDIEAPLFDEALKKQAVGRGGHCHAQLSSNAAS